MPALAILIPRRGVSTDTHTPGAPPSGPPPGFNPDQAKKPLKDSNDSSKAPTKETAANMAEKHDVGPVPGTKAIAVPKTDATAGKKDKSVEATDTKKEEKKLTLGQKIKKEAQHYWDGTKLLATEVRISTRLALKMAAGYELSRREYRQLQRTVQDIGRLVPFSVFVLVPFAELLLPVALKLFPNLLPSTYEGQKSKDSKATTLRATRKDVSNFLRNTLKETGLPLSPSNAQKDEFLNFFRKVRSTGEQPTSSDVINVCKIFKDDLTLDNLSRPQLVGMCRYMNLNTFGTDMMLRYQIRHRMRQIKRDDRAISYEGVDSLSVPELQVAAASRGIRTHGVSPARLRDDIQSWLDLRLKYGVPSTLLVLSNAFMYAQGKESEFSTQIDALTGVLSSIPEELFHEIELEVHNAEGAATNKQRLEVLKEQQELIEEENEQDEENKESGRATPRDDEDIDEKEERRLEAQSNAAAKEQVSEAIDAEKEGAEAQRKEARADEKKSS
jgi:LETM1 and EF-hand domain-containing protein 1, mitochondrial